MNLTQLQSLIAVAEAGSFTAAADKLGVTHSVTSQPRSESARSTMRVRRFHIWRRSKGRRWH